MPPPSFECIVVKLVHPPMEFARMIESSQKPVAPIGPPTGDAPPLVSVQSGLIALMTIAAVMVTAWQQWRREEEFSRLEMRNDELRMAYQREKNWRILFWSFDLTNPKHREALVLLKEINDYLRGGGYSGNLLTSKTLPDDYKVLVSSDIVSASSSPENFESTATVAVLRRGEELIDVVYLDSSLQRETHRVFLPKTSDQDVIVVIFELHPSGPIDPHGHSLRFRATKSRL